MKICLLSNDYVSQFKTFGYGGIEIVVESLAQGLYDSGSDFFVICPKREVVTEYPFKIIETDEHPTSVSGKDSTAFAWSAKKIIAEEKPDVIWSQSNWSADVLKDLGIPIICTFHDSCSKQWGWMKKSRNVFYRFLSEFSYGNWVTEDWEREVSFVCHSGIVSDDYSFSSSSENYWLWVGGLRWGMKAKGLDLTMDLARKCPNQEIRVYGGGNPALENELNLHSQKYPNFRYLGELKRGSDHKEVFSKAKLFLMPTAIPDTFPRVVLESMSKGTPVLGSNFGSIPEMVGEKGGSIFDPFISEKDISIAESRDRKEVFDWSQKFSIEKEVEKLKDVSLKILQNRKLF